MSNYPIWWDTAVTVYNKYEDPQTQVISWYRHTIDGCFWKSTGDKVNIGDVVLDTNSIICRIPKQDTFIENYVWQAKPNDEMSAWFTLNVGDIVVKGVVDDEINEYQQGHHSSDFIAKYKKLQGCLEIQEFAINIGRGRNNPHYYVRGI